MDILRARIKCGCYFTIGVEVLYSDHIKGIAKAVPDHLLLTEKDNPGGMKWLQGEGGRPARVNTNDLIDVTFGFWRGEGRLRNRERRNVKIIPGPNRRNKQPKGLARVAFEVEAHCSRSEGFLPP